MSDYLHLHPNVDERTLFEELEDAATSKVEQLTLYNLDVSPALAKAIVQFLDTHLRHIRRNEDKKGFVLEVLGCSGSIDRVLESFASGKIDEGEDDGEEGEIPPQPLQRRLILQHTHWNHFDASVFASLGMALDERRMRSRSQSSDRDPLRLTLFQPVLSEAKLWAVAQGIQSSRHLKELDLSSCCLTPLHVNEVTNIMAEGFRQNEHLESLSFDSCELDDNQLTCLLEGLQGHPTLKSLHLANNRLRSGSMIALAVAFATKRESSQDKELLCLNIDLSQPIISQNNSRDDLGNHILLVPDVTRTWQASKTFRSRLSILNLSSCQFNDNDLKILLSILFFSTKHGRFGSFLERLHLSENKFTEEGIQCLADVIQNYQSDKRHHRWTQLSLEDNNPKFSGRSGQRLVEAMKVNVDLEELEFSDCSPDNSWSSAHLCRYFTLLNKGGRRAVGDNSLPVAAWPFLLERVNHRVDWGATQRDQHKARINVLYHLVASGNLFVDR